MDIKIEIKEEPLWEDGATEPKHQSEITFVSVPTSPISKKETNAEKVVYEDLLSLDPTRLSTEAVYCDGSITSTFLDHSDLGSGETEEVASDLKTANVVEKNINKEFSKTESICPDKCELPSELVVNKMTEEELKCDFSDEKSFKQKSELKQHTVYHSGTKSYKCDRCEKHWKRKSDLRKHILCHLGVILYKCEICDKGFYEKHDLNKHVLCHSGTKSHKCDSCNRSYKRKSDLKKHVVCHLGTKPYACDDCGKGFYQKSDLKKHSVCHSDTKLHKCHSCDKSFKWKANLTKHNISHLGTKS